MFVNYYSKLILILIIFININVFGNKKYEMRAVWIATIANIDWPSTRNLTGAQQRNEISTMLDKFAENHINAIYVQIRPTSDAFYPSQLEPWSHWLTGKQGKKPEPFFDPLQFIIDEARKRCMEVHVWLNPYRVTNSENLDILHPKHLFFKNKDLFVKYGGKYYFDPGLDETREFLNLVVQDIVEKYDVDAIHFDDYFYPYKVNNEDFPDSNSFKRFPRGFLPNQKDDWRRNNVNLVIAELNKTIKSVKPWVQFGISPFGVWRNQSSDPRGSATQAGVQNYDDLYADILKWLKEGTIDYVVPQLYWEIGKKVADYEVLVKWWSDNSCGRNLYIGHYVSALENSKVSAWQKPNEIARQLRMNQIYPQVEGSVYFSAKTFVKNLKGLNDSLKTNFYRYPALCPVNKTLPGEPSAQPQNMRVLKDHHDTFLIWDEVNEEGGCEVKYYVIYAFKGKKVGDLNDPSNILLRTADNCIDLNEVDLKLKGTYTFVVTAVNKFRQESIPSYGITRKI